MQQKLECSKTARSEWPASKAARKMLKEHFGLVRKYLHSSAERPGEDVEYVHQLRVATRRTLAAMQVFEEALPKKRARQLRKELCRLRRSAGRARDLDVLRCRLDEEFLKSDELNSHAIDRVTRNRKSAQKALRQAVRRWKREQNDRKIKRFLERIGWRQNDPEPNFAAIAESKLSIAAHDFFSACEDDLSQICVLHDLRIRGKRLRYTLEIASEAIESSMFDGWFEDLKQLQDRLGTVVDHATAKTLFTKWTEQTSCGNVRAHLGELAAIEDERIQKSFQRFREWWTPERIRDLQSQLDQPLGC